MSTKLQDIKNRLIAIYYLLTKQEYYCGFICGKTKGGEITAVNIANGRIAYLGELIDSFLMQRMDISQYLYMTRVNRITEGLSKEVKKPSTKFKD